MADTSDGDDIPDQREILWFGEALPHDGDRDLGSSWAPQSFHAIHEGEIFCRFSIDLKNLISGQDSSLEGGSIFDGRDDGEDTLFNGDLDSQSLKPTLCLLLHLFIHIGRHEGGVGI